MSDPTTTEMDAMRPAFLEPLAKSRRAAAEKHVSNLAFELGRMVTRVKYLAMAATVVADGCAIPEPERGNCAGYLLDLLEYLGGQTEKASESLQTAIDEAFEEVQA